MPLNDLLIQLQGLARCLPDEMRDLFEPILPPESDAVLGVPTVRDRVVHATLKQLLEPLFEPGFSTHIYGFRPQRNQRQEVEAARQLSNIVLDELDKELERRGLDFCRFADDCNLFVKTPRAAERAMGSISGYLEKRLNLVVNQEQSQVTRSDRVQFG